jgi:hypothetical protein
MKHGKKYVSFFLSQCQKKKTIMNESRDELYYQIIKLKDKIAELEAENERFRKFITQIEPLDKLRQERDDLKAEIDGFWEALYWSYNVESRKEIEADTVESWAEGTSPLAVALHFVWKRDPKIVKLTDALEGVIASWNKGGDIVGPMLNAKEALSKNK